MYSDKRKAGFLTREEFYNALKLVTVAQKGRELSPDIVKAALEGPAAAKIPAPQINAVTAPPVRQMAAPRPPVHSMVPTPSQTPGFIPSSQLFSHPNGQHLRSNQAPYVGQGIPGVVMGPSQQTPNPGNPSLPIEWQGGGVRPASLALNGPTPIGQAQVRAPSPAFSGSAPSVIGQAQPALITSASQTLQPVSVNASTTSTKPVDPLLSLQPLTKSSNGFSSDSVFGGDLFSAASKTKATTTSGFVGSIVPNSSAGIVPPSSLSQASVTPVPNTIVQGSSAVGRSLEMAQNRVISATPISSVGGAVGLAPRPTERPWPKFTQSDILRYSKVFAAVDKDRDGKITGEEARTLFLSWKLPRGSY